MLKMDQRKILDGEKKLDKNSLLFDFFLIQKPRIVPGLSPDKRMVSSFVHAKEEWNTPKAHTPKKDFHLTFSLVSHREKLS